MDDKESRDYVGVALLRRRIYAAANVASANAGTARRIIRRTVHNRVGNVVRGSHKPMKILKLIGCIQTF